MLAYFQERKEKIDRFLRDFLDRRAGELTRVNSLGEDAVRRLYDFSSRGKMIRGGLVSLGYISSGRGRQPSAGEAPLIEAGGAMELLQAGLLIHDDIMDRDLSRRGVRTVHRQYAELAGREGAGDTAHLGVSMGMCAGDIAFFLAFEILAGLRVPAGRCRQITGMAARELSSVAVAQMQDIWAASAAAGVTEDEILRLYLYKTGRYTFSLPLMTGCLLMGGDPSMLSALERLGETLGIIFQIKDDELGLYGDPQATGKPVGSDLREGKRTLYFERLRLRAGAQELKRLGEIFGSAEIGADDVEYVRRLTHRLGVRDEVRRRAEELAGQAREIIAALPPAAGPGRDVLLEVLDYSLTRDR